MKHKVERATVVTLFRIDDPAWDWSAVLLLAALVTFIVLLVVFIAAGDRVLGRWSWYANRQAERAIERATLEAQERRAASREFPGL